MVWPCSAWIIVPGLGLLLMSFAAAEDIGLCICTIDLSFFAGGRSGMKVDE